MPKLHKLSSILSVFALFLFAVVAHAQGTVVTSVQVGDGAGSGSGAEQGSGSVRSSNSARVVGGVGSFMVPGLGGVKGRPFSADVIEETDQFLADGNHIHRETHGKIFRDSEGRSRVETEFGGMMLGKSLVHIQISDPVQNTSIFLDPQQKIALVHHFGERSGGGTELKPPQRVTGIAQPGARPPATDSQALVQRLGDRQGPRSNGQFSHEDLGTMEIDGFTVRGTRFTNTFPAGSRGNDQPMTTTNERWYSDELRLELLTKSSSPESGQHTRKLVNISSGDPDPLVFQVPADYTVREQQQ
jgi:hypothetical protein